MRPLEQQLKQANISYAVLGQTLDVSKSQAHKWVTQGRVPRKSTAEALQQKTTALLIECGVDKKKAEAATSATVQPKKKTVSNEENDIMLLRKNRLNQQAKQHFGLMRDPFDEVREPDDVFLTADARYVRETMRTTCRHGGFVAIVGESGSGKTTLRRDLMNWARQEPTPIEIIQPYVLGMEDNDIKGKTLKTTHIAESILGAIAPHESPKRSAEVRFRQVHQALLESHRAGNRHVLLIEEAHSLPIPTLKHLKRLLELEADDGFSGLIGVILIGQTELANKLNERNPKVREVVQRCELIHLGGLNADLSNYLRHRFQRAGKELDAVMDNACIEALHKKLMGDMPASVLFPLAVNNVLSAAMNEAAVIGETTLTPDIITEI